MKRPRRLFEEEERGGFAFREVFTPNREGPLPPRPHRSGKGGPSINQSGTGPVVTSVWSASDAAANAMTLSNGGLTVTPPVTGSYMSARGSVSKTSGKLYIEFANSAAVTSVMGFGLASASFIPASYLGSSNYSCGLMTNGNEFLSVGFTLNVGMPAPAIGTSDVFALAVDFTAGAIWIAQNNVWLNTGNPGTGINPMVLFVPATVGALFPGLTVYPSAGTPGVWTLQPTAASQKYTPPAGFSPWG